jgi:hypothetical protein
MIERASSSIPADILALINRRLDSSTEDVEITVEVETEDGVVQQASIVIPAKRDFQLDVPALRGDALNRLLGIA